MAQNHVFVWRDLMCTDVEKGWAFYEKMFDWKKAEMSDDSGIPYTMILDQNDKPLGGMVPFDLSYPEEPDGENIAPLSSHWMNYIQVDDVAAKVAQTEADGGKVCVPPCVIDDIGIFAIIETPQQSTVSLMQYTTETPPSHPISQDVGHFCWMELQSPSVEEDVAFYQNLLSWDVEKHPQDGSYLNIKTDEKAEVAGATSRPKQEIQQPGWLTYVMVDDVDSSTQLAKELGAAIVIDTQSLGGGRKYAVMACPTGEHLGLFSN